MKKFYIAAVLALALGLGACKSGKPEGEAAEAKTREDKVSYGIGMDIGANLKSFPVKLNPALVAKGVTDVMTDAKLMLAPEDVKTAMTELQTEMMAKQVQEMEQLKAKAEANKAAGEKFLAENKGKEGVIATKSGLQYKILQKGSGPKPKADDTVEVDYRGTLIDGTEFDSSYSRNQTAEFPVGGVIPGFQEALQLMEPGGKYQVFIPSDLAYGPRQAGTIPPYSVLIFEMDLKGVKPKK